MDYEIIDKKVNFKNPQLVLSNGKGKIGKVPRNISDNLISHFEELKASKKGSYSPDDLKEVNEVMRKRNVAKTKVLRKDDNLGFITIGSITIIGFLIIGFIIFNVAGFVVGR